MIEGVLLIVLASLFVWMFESINEKVNKLAKDYNLEKFLDAISYEKISYGECVDKIIKKLSEWVNKKIKVKYVKQL